jgi:hypothetical protein
VPNLTPRHRFAVAFGYCGAARESAFLRPTLSPSASFSAFKICSPSAWNVDSVQRRARTPASLSTLAQLFGCLVGERDGEDVVGAHAAVEQVADAVGDDARLARAAAAGAARLVRLSAAKLARVR